MRNNTEFKAVFLIQCLILFAGTLGNTAFGQETLNYQGTTLFGQECFLSVTQIDEEFIDVETSFDHDGFGPGVLTISQQDSLNWTGQSSSSEIIVASDGNTSEFNPVSYDVRWLHGDHEDRGSCSALELFTE